MKERPNMSIETLTAYKLNFSFMERNNPLLEDQREAIRAGKKPDYTLDDFFDDYIGSARQMAVGESTERAILLSNENYSIREIGASLKCWYLCPRAGKQGQPVTIYKKSTGKEYNYSSDAAALYEHHIFIYQEGDIIIAVFYRKNGSGCKSVFMETANKMLKAKGFKLEMELCVPTQQLSMDFEPSKITLQFVRENKSSDIADYYFGKKKKTVIRDIGFNLEAPEYAGIKKYVEDYKLGKLTSDTAFQYILKKCPEGSDYNDAEIQMRVGSRKKTMRWNEIEGEVGSYDITNALKADIKQGMKFIEALSKQADNYYSQIADDLKGDAENGK